MLWGCVVVFLGVVGLESGMQQFFFFFLLSKPLLVCGVVLMLV